MRQFLGLELPRCEGAQQICGLERYCRKLYGISGIRCSGIFGAICNVWFPQGCFGGLHHSADLRTRGFRDDVLGQSGTLVGGVLKRRGRKGDAMRKRRSAVHPPRVQWCGGPSGVGSFLSPPSSARPSSWASTPRGGASGAQGSEGSEGGFKKISQFPVFRRFRPPPVIDPR